MLGFSLSQRREQQDQTCYSTCLTESSNTVTVKHMLLQVKGNTTQTNAEEQTQGVCGLWTDRRRWRGVSNGLSAPCSDLTKQCSLLQQRKHDDSHYPNQMCFIRGSFTFPD